MQKQIYLVIFSLLLVLDCLAQRTISVLYFENTKEDPEYQWLHKGLADMLITDLAGTPGIHIVEREALEKILNEQALSLSGLMEDHPAIEVGKLLQAEILLYGAYIIHDDEIRIDLRIAEVTSGQIIHGFEVQGEVDDLFDLEVNIVKQIKEKLKLKPQQIPRAADTKSVKALARFYTGLDYLDNKRYEEAQVQFNMAKELDPLFYRAQESLAESYKFLKAFKEYRQQREIAELYSKIKILQERIDAPDWLSFSDIVQSPQYQAMSIEEQQAFNASHNEYLICQTRAQCTWHMMITFYEIGNKYGQYYNDTTQQNAFFQRIVETGNKSKETYATDPFLPEILYFRLVALYSLKEYDQLKSSAEEFMVTYPDFRMVETVEDYYQKALEAHTKKQ